jgi:hypothetical protein
MGYVRELLLCALALALSLPGCKEEAPDPEIEDAIVFVDSCSSDQDCLPTAVCINKKCGKECTISENCPPGAECVLYRCKLPEAGALDVLPDVEEKTPCSKHLDCDPLGMACLDGFCGRECTKDWHCEGEGAVCIGYMCKGGSPPEDTVQSPDVTTEPDALPAGCDPTPGAYGAACSCEQECASSLCVQNKITMSSMCTQYCQTDAQCPGPDICIVLPEAAICVINDSGQSTSCDPDQALCYSGNYLTNKLGKCVCTTKCTKAADCPDGFACHVLGADKVCVSTGEVCTTNYNPCYGQCAGDPAAGTGFCTAICISSTDCPSGWTCQTIQQGVKVCASPF